MRGQVRCFSACFTVDVDFYTAARYPDPEPSRQRAARDIAEQCEFEEIAYLIVHEKLPTQAELDAYKAKLKSMRDIPQTVKTVLEQLPASTHPMDVMRTGCSALGCQMPEAADHDPEAARDIVDRLMACFGSMLVYWYHYSHNGKRIEPITDDDSIGGHFLHLLHGEPPRESWVKAMHVSLILYAEHEFNASTFTGRVVAGTGSVRLHSAACSRFCLRPTRPSLRKDETNISAT